MKTYLVIGGAGFIGSHLVEALAIEPAVVFVVDPAAIPQSGSPKITVISSRAAAPEALRLITEEKPEAVYFLAGPIGLRKPVNTEEFDVALASVAEFKSVCDACAVARVKLVFVSSGGAMYGKPDNIPTKETSRACPDSVYGAANLFMEEIVKKSGAPYVILRFSNIYGERQWSDGVVPSFIIQAAQGKPMAVNGSGRQTRDFLYVGDAVSALLKTGQGRHQGVFNVGSGEELTINRLAKEIQGIMGVVGKVIHRPSGGGVPRSVLDSSKFRKTFAWKPKTLLAEGLKKTVDFYARTSVKKP